MTGYHANETILKYNERLKPALKADLLKYMADHPDEQDAAQVLAFLAAQSNLFGRDAAGGHITCSAWVVDPSLSRTILVLHRRLGRWIQPGGHIEPFETPFEGARREALEETGLHELFPAGESLFHVSVHPFPEGKDGPAHLHYDLSYFFFAPEAGPLIAPPETEGAAWVELDRIADYTEEATIIDMVEKTAAQRGRPFNDRMGIQR